DFRPHRRADNYLRRIAVADVRDERLSADPGRAGPVYRIGRLRSRVFRHRSRLRAGAARALPGIASRMAHSHAAVVHGLRHGFGRLASGCDRSEEHTSELQSLAY